MLTIAFTNLLFWLKHPNMIVPRIKYWFWEKTHPDEPWLCPGTVEFCKQHLTKSMTVLEFGSGRSSAWFARRVEKLISIEQDESWYQSVKTNLEQENVTNINLRLILLDHSYSEPEREVYEPLPNYVAVLEEFADESLDFVIVDGHYRTNCTRKSINKIKPGGYLLIDDTNMWPSLDALNIPKDWKIVDKSTNGIKTAIVWQKP